VLKNPSKWPSNWQTILSSPAADGTELDFTEYVNGGYSDVNLIKTLCPAGLANIVYNGDTITPGGGLDICFLYSNFSYSATRILQHMYLRQFGTNSSLGSNTNFSFYGNDTSKFGANTIYTSTLSSPLYVDDGDALTRQPFRFQKNANAVLRIDKDNALTATYINKNYHKHDGISDHNVEAVLREFGAEGRTSYGVTFSDSTTWRDFRLERAVQQAILGPAPTPYSAFMLSGPNQISTTNPLLARSPTPFAWA